MKFINLILILAASCLVRSSHAQAPSWQWAKHWHSRGLDQITNVVTDAAGNLYVAGTFTDTIALGNTTLISAGGSDFFLTKFTAQGTVTWAKSYGASTGDEEAYVLSITPYGKLVITGVGYGNSMFGHTLTGNSTTFACGFDLNGVLQWSQADAGLSSKIFSGTAVDHHGNTLIGGSFLNKMIWGSDTVLASHTGLMPFITKLDTAGHPLWTRPLITQGYSGVFDITADKWDNVYAVGSFNDSINFGNGVFSPGEMFLVKYNAQGQLQWGRAIPSGPFSDAFSVVSDSDGNVFISGIYATQAVFGQAALNSASPAANFLAKYDSSGTALWAKDLSHASFGGMSSLDIDAAQNLYCSFIFRDSVKTGVFDTVIGNKAMPFVSRLDKNGNFSWGKVIATRLNWRVDITPVAADVYVSGMFGDTLNCAGNRFISDAAGDIFVAKLSQSANSVNPVARQKTTLSVFPNPTDGKFTIVAEGPVGRRWRVCDVMGRECLGGAVTGKSMLVDAGQLAPGLYRVLVTGEGGQAAVPLLITR